jgi:enoyl-CoA hydratase
VDAAYELPLDEGLQVEGREEQGLFEHGEAVEGIRAFIAKRPPNFS